MLLGFFFCLSLVVLRIIFVHVNCLQSEKAQSHTKLLCYFRSHYLAWHVACSALIGYMLPVK